MLTYQVTFEEWVIQTSSSFIGKLTLEKNIYTKLKTQSKG